jgi:hypothetical protein
MLPELRQRLGNAERRLRRKPLLADPLLALSRVLLATGEQPLGVVLLPERSAGTMMKVHLSKPPSHTQHKASDMCLPIQLLVQQL